MPLRHVQLVATALGDNQTSFTNTSDSTLKFRKLLIEAMMTGGLVANDQARFSLDEIPIAQIATNGSRSHIIGVVVKVGTDLTSGRATKQIALAGDDLVLRPDESVFLNTTDVTGAATVECNVGIWYED